MKNLTLSLLILFLIPHSVNAQNPLVFGLDCSEGSDGIGQLFSMDSNFTNVTVRKDLVYNGIQEGNFSGNLCLASNGKYYGFSNMGQNQRIIFEYDLNSNAVKTVYKFDFNQFDFPADKLVKSANGDLYGVASYGLNKPYGVIFKFNPTNYSVLIVHSFIASNQNPHVAPIITNNNKLYGATNGGWSNTEEGSFYEFDIQTGIFRDIIHFDQSNNNLTGWYKGGNSRLVEGPDSCIYGVREGNYPYYGRLYRYNYNTDVLTRIYQFDTRNGNGERQFEDLKFVNNSLFISSYTSNTSINSNAAFYKMDVSSSSVTIDKKFSIIDSIHGSIPIGEIYINSKQQIISTFNKGGANKLGTIFKIDTNLLTASVKEPFSKSKRIYKPNGRIIPINDSLIIGFASNLPSQPNFTGLVNRYRFGVGAIYSYNFTTDSAKIKVAFGSSDLGHVPTNSLIDIGNNKVCWANKRGGANFSGTILIYNLLMDSTYKIYDVDSSLFDEIISLTTLNNNTLLGIGRKDTLAKIFEFNLNTNLLNITDSQVINKDMFAASEYGFTKASNGKYYYCNEKSINSSSGAIFEYNASTKTSRQVYQFAANQINELSPYFVEKNQKLYASYNNGILELNINTDSVRLYPMTIASHRLADKTSLSLHSNGKIYGFSYKNSPQESWLFQFDESRPMNNQYTIKTFVMNHQVQSSGSFYEASNQKFYFNCSSKEFLGYTNTDRNKLLEYDVNSNNLRLIRGKNTNINCGAINNFILINSNVVGVSEKIVKEFGFYPNPANDYITINSEERILYIDILSLEGRIIKRFKGKTKIDVSFLPNALYFIKVHMNQQTITKKLMIAR